MKSGKWNICLLCLGAVLCVLLAYGVGGADVQKRVPAAEQTVEPKDTASPAAKPTIYITPMPKLDDYGYDSNDILAWADVGDLEDYEVYCKWISEGKGTYHFHADMVARKLYNGVALNSVVTDVIPIQGNWAKIHYNKKTKTLRIIGTGDMFYDDFTRPFDSVDDYIYRWERIDYPFDVEKVQKIIVEPGVTEVSRDAFEGFCNVKEIILPDTVKTIRAFAFNGCYSLEKLTIPDSVTTIGREAFGHANNSGFLRQVVIGKNVRKIGKGNFLGMRIQELQVAKGNKYFEVKDGILYGIKDKKAYIGCDGIKHMSIRDGTVEIGEFAFSYNHTLRTIQIPNSVRKIGGGAFCECKKLEKIQFGKKSKCKSFGKYFIPPFDCGEVGGTYSAIAYCPKLKEICIPDGIEELGGNLYCCEALRKIYVGKSLNLTKKDEDGESEVKVLRFSKKRYYVVSPENPWCSSKNGKLYNKAGTKLIDEAKKKLRYYP